jgi:hypothetical protein
LFSSGVQFLFGLEVRAHLSARLAFLLGAHLANASSQVPSRMQDGGFSYEFEAEYKTREGLWQVGIDLGLIEHRMYHLQIGPRLGWMFYNMEISPSSFDAPTGSDAVDFSEAQVKALFADNFGDTEVKGVDPAGGVALRIGAFPLPFVEVGLHAEIDAVIATGVEGPMYTGGVGVEQEYGFYTVVHF